MSLYADHVKSLENALNSVEACPKHVAGAVAWAEYGSPGFRFIFSGTSCRSEVQQSLQIHRLIGKPVQRLRSLDPFCFSPFWVEGFGCRIDARGNFQRSTGDLGSPSRRYNGSEDARRDFMDLLLRCL